MTFLIFFWLGMSFCCNIIFVFLTLSWCQYVCHKQKDYTVCHTIDCWPINQLWPILTHKYWVWSFVSHLIILPRELKTLLNIPDSFLADVSVSVEWIGSLLLDPIPSLVYCCSIRPFLLMPWYNICFWLSGAVLPIWVNSYFRKECPSAICCHGLVYGLLCHSC